MNTHTCPYCSSKFEITFYNEDDEEINFCPSCGTPFETEEDYDEDDEENSYIDSDD
jgi:Zn ribbon nucleic-acid-binding protein